MIAAKYRPTVSFEQWSYSLVSCVSRRAGWANNLHETKMTSTRLLSQKSTSTTPEWNTWTINSVLNNVSNDSAASDWLKFTPRALRNMLNYIKQRFNDPEIIITENGFSDTAGYLDDAMRIHYFKYYINNVLKGETRLVKTTFWDQLRLNLFDLKCQISYSRWRQGDWLYSLVSTGQLWMGKWIHVSWSAKDYVITITLSEFELQRKVRPSLRWL